MCELLVKYFLHFLLIFLWFKFLLMIFTAWCIGQLKWCASLQELDLFYEELGVRWLKLQYPYLAALYESDVVNMVKLCIILECYLDTILRADTIWLSKQ